MVNMKVKSYGQEPEETEGLVLVSWTHSMACISTYGIHLCLTGEESCWEGSLEGSQLGETLKLDLGALLLPNRLHQCSSYTLTILPSDKVRKKKLLSIQHLFYEISHHPASDRRAEVPFSRRIFTRVHLHTRPLSSTGCSLMMKVMFNNKTL